LPIYIVKDMMKKNLILSLKIILSLLAIFLSLTGCATMQAENRHAVPQVITVEKGLTVHTYNDFAEMRKAYMYRGGNPAIMNRVKGFYSDTDNSIHCLKWDFYTCGHELFHALQYKGDKTLFVEKGYEHFKGYNYTSQE